MSNGPSRKTPHRQRSPIRRLRVAVLHRLKLLQAQLEGEGDIEMAWGYASAIQELKRVLVWLDHIEVTDKSK